jgi:hypothetical protein
VHPALELVECFREVPDGKGLTETSASFVPLSIAFTSGVPVGVGLVAGALADNSSAEISLRYRSGTVSEGPGVSLVVMKTCRSREPRLESLVATSVGVWLCWSVLLSWSQGVSFLVFHPMLLQPFLAAIPTQESGLEGATRVDLCARAMDFRPKVRLPP